jgi:ssDNA-binding Zn-finger/Zn-ribbon topoisomerase 1
MIDDDPSEDLISMYANGNCPLCGDELVYIEGEFGYYKCLTCGYSEEE